MVCDLDSYLFILLSAVICSFDDIPNVQLCYGVFMIIYMAVRCKA